MKRLHVTGIVLIPLLVTACSSEREVVRLCPQTAIIRELARVSDYGSEPASDENLVALAEMKGVEGECSYKSDGVDLSFEVSLLAGKGPRLGGNQFGFPYFISIVNPEQKIVAKEMLTVNFNFREDKKPTETIEPLHVFIPMSENSDGTNYQVLVGFQFTEKQLAAVRRAEEQKIKNALGKQPTR